MTKTDIIRMARESGGLPDPMVFYAGYERFAHLVAAHKAEVALAEAYRCGYEAGVVAEREECAKAAFYGYYINLDGDEMKLTEEQIWKCNNDGEGGVHICLDHQNVVDFAHALEREIGFARAELWIKRINEAVAAEREACAKLFDNHNVWDEEVGERIRARGTK